MERDLQLKIIHVNRHETYKSYLCQIFHVKEMENQTKAHEL